MSSTTNRPMGYREHRSRATLSFQLHLARVEGGIRPHLLLARGFLQGVFLYLLLRRISLLTATASLTWVTASARRFRNVRFASLTVKPSLLEPGSIPQTTGWVCPWLRSRSWM
jgi:hypothetical protein